MEIELDATVSFRLTSKEKQRLTDTAYINKTTQAELLRGFINSLPNIELVQKTEGEQ